MRSDVPIRQETVSCPRCGECEPVYAVGMDIANDPYPDEGDCEVSLHFACINLHHWSKAYIIHKVDHVYEETRVHPDLSDTEWDDMKLEWKERK